MAIILKLDRSGRIFLSVVLILFSLLVIGAEKITFSLKSRDASLLTDMAKWKDISLKIGKELPAEHRIGWAEYVNSDPKSFIVVNTHDYSVFSSDYK